VFLLLHSLIIVDLPKLRTQCNRFRQIGSRGHSICTLFATCNVPLVSEERDLELKHFPGVHSPTLEGKYCKNQWSESIGRIQRLVQVGEYTYMVCWMQRFPRKLENWELTYFIIVIPGIRLIGWPKFSSHVPTQGTGWLSVRRPHRSTDANARLGCYWVAFASPLGRDLMV
jgi:hypothetical protein